MSTRHEQTTRPDDPAAAGSEPAPLHVAFVLDASGSMAALAGAVVEGFDDFLRSVREDDAGATRFSLTLFDTRLEHRHVAVPLADVLPLDVGGYRPDGMTALFDAVAHTVLETDQQLAVAGRASEKVMVVVLTDGLENASTDYDARAIARLVARYDERPNWTFVYLGAGHETLADARRVAGDMAFAPGNAMRWEAEATAVRRTMRSLGDAAASRRRSAALKTRDVFEEARQSPADYEAGPVWPPADGR